MIEDPEGYPFLIRRLGCAFSGRRLAFSVFRESRRLVQLLHRMDNSKTSPPGGWGKTFKT